MGRARLGDGRPRGRQVTYVHARLAEKEGDLSKDQSRDEQNEVQKLTDKFITEIENHLADKEADILKV